MRRAAKVDANHGEIVRVLRDAQCAVLSLAAVGKGCPDLLVHPRSRPWWCARPDMMTREELERAVERLLAERLVLQEVKDGSKPQSAIKLTKAQREFDMPFHIVTNTHEALYAAGFRRG